jgi:hypothetical protein
MLGNAKLVLDQNCQFHCEVYDLLRPFADDDFYELKDKSISPGDIYVVGYAQFEKHRDWLVDLAKSNTVKIVMSHTSEGSWTMIGVLRALGIEQLVKSKKILLISTGDMDDSWANLTFDSYILRLHNHKENLKAYGRTQEIYSKPHKPYKFLFLNGIGRPHRKYLIESFALTGTLDQALWSSLDSGTIDTYGWIDLIYQGKNLILNPRPVKYLPPQYEYDSYQDRVGMPTTDTFVKNHLFNNTWGDIYLKAEPYIDTYFSLVTETVFFYPHSLRSEKIWKPIAMGHPFVVAANYGFYRDLHKLGFKTFGHLIDESFDTIENNQSRIERIAAVVEDLCQQDLVSFLDSCRDICKYNQQRYAEAILEVREEFPKRFFNFINQHWPNDQC